jgi:hypothetical protein
MIYLRIVIYEDLFERTHVDLLELMYVDLFPKIYRNLFRSPEREQHNKRCYLVRGWWQTPSCLPAVKRQTRASYKINLAFYGQI